jgi:tubulin-specific chaperone A
MGEKQLEKGCLSRENKKNFQTSLALLILRARIMTTTTTTTTTDQQQQLLRQLKIKTGVLRRLSKEQKMYEREVLDLNNAMIASSSVGAPPTATTMSSQQMQCLEESKAMVRDTSVRLEKAFVDLEELVESASKEEGENIAEKEEFVNAKAMVEEVKPSLT